MGAGRGKNRRAKAVNVVAASLSPEDYARKWIGEGQVFNFADLPEDCKKALAVYLISTGMWDAPWTDDEGPLEDNQSEKEFNERFLQQIDKEMAAITQLYRGEKFGTLSVPTKELADSMLQGRDISRDYDDFKEYHNAYLAGDVVPDYGASVWPVILDTNLGETLEDGWHRFHSYYRKGLKTVPAIYFAGE